MRRSLQTRRSLWTRGPVADAGLVDSSLADASLGLDASSDSGALSFASEGCGVAQPIGERTLSMTVRGEERTYKVFIQDGYDPTRPVPIVMHFHGCSSSFDFAFRLHMRQGVHAAFGAGAVFVYPQGLANSGCSAGWEMSNEGKDVEFVERIRAEVSAQFCIDTRPMVITGSSYGGDFVNQYSCARPETVLIAVAQAMSPWDSSACHGPVPMVLAYALDDPYFSSFVGPGFVASRDFWRTQNGCAMTSTAEAPSPCVRYDGCGANPLITCELSEGGHDAFPADFGANLHRWYLERLTP
jgi:polyhydroxybutyrate depolymerase